MRISQRGIEALKRHEGLRLHSYPDPATGGEPWTIGYGRAHGVSKDQQITEPQAEQYLREDLQWVEDAIKETVTAPLTQAQFDALCSLIYNIGEGAFRKSTLLRKLNAKDYMGAVQEFVRWNMAAGKAMPGLTNRRVLEAKMFESEGVIDTSPEPVQKAPESVHVEYPIPPVDQYTAPRPDQEPYTQPEPKKMAFPLALVAGLLPSVIELIPPLTRIFKPGSAVAERNVAAASAVLDTVVKATKAVNAQDAIERMKADPSALAEATKAVTGWVEMVEAGGGGIEGARKQDAAVRAAGNMLHSPSFWMACGLLLLVFWMMGNVMGLYGAPMDEKVRSAILNGAQGMILGGIVGYFFGQTTSRNRTPAP
jgi:lysozyme